jgi:hypothetical protein
VSPAAVELYVTLDLLEESVARVALTPDTAPEGAELPAPETLGGALLLADRDYPSCGRNCPVLVDLAPAARTASPGSIPLTDPSWSH